MVLLTPLLLVCVTVYVRSTPLALASHIVVRWCISLRACIWSSAILFIVVYIVLACVRGVVENVLLAQTSAKMISLRITVIFLAHFFVRRNDPMSSVTTDDELCVLISELSPIDHDPCDLDYFSAKARRFSEKTWLEWSALPVSEQHRRLTPRICDALEQRMQSGRFQCADRRFWVFFWFLSPSLLLSSRIPVLKTTCIVFIVHCCIVYLSLFPSGDGGVDRPTPTGEMLMCNGSEVVCATDLSMLLFLAFHLSINASRTLMRGLCSTSFIGGTVRSGCQHRDAAGQCSCRASEAKC